MFEVFERLIDWAGWLVIAIGSAIMVDSLLNAPDAFDYVLAGIYFAIVLAFVALKALTRRRRGG